jgi:hypothetical protein
MARKQISKEGKQDLAFALILLKDFKSGGKFDPGDTSWRSLTIWAFMKNMTR